MVDGLCGRDTRRRAHKLWAWCCSQDGRLPISCQSLVILSFDLAWFANSYISKCWWLGERNGQPETAFNGVDEQQQDVKQSIGNSCQGAHTVLTERYHVIKTGRRLEFASLPEVLQGKRAILPRKAQMHNETVSPILLLRALRLFHQAHDVASAVTDPQLPTYFHARTQRLNDPIASSAWSDASFTL